MLKTGKSTITIFLSALVVVKAFVSSKKDTNRFFFAFEDFVPEQLKKSKERSRRKRGVAKMKKFTGFTQENSEYYLGERLFITCKIEHPNAPDFPRTSRDAFANFVIDGDRLILNRVSLTPFVEESGVVSYGDEFYQLPASFPENLEKALTVTSDYRGLERVRLWLEDEYKPPTVNISKEDNLVHLAVEDREQVVESGQESEMTLSEQEVEVQPVLQIHNQGHLNVFGSSEKGLLPLNSEDSYAKKRVSSILANSEEDVERDEENDLLVLP